MPVTACNLPRKNGMLCTHSCEQRLQDLLKRYCFVLICHVWDKISWHLSGKMVIGCDHCPPQGVGRVGGTRGSRVHLANARMCPLPKYGVYGKGQLRWFVVKGAHGEMVFFKTHFPKLRQVVGLPFFLCIGINLCFQGSRELLVALFLTGGTGRTPLNLIRQDKNWRGINPKLQLTWGADLHEVWNTLNSGAYDRLVLPCCNKDSPRNPEVSLHVAMGPWIHLVLGRGGLKDKTPQKGQQCALNNEIYIIIKLLGLPCLAQFGQDGVGGGV